MLNVQNKKLFLNYLRIMPSEASKSNAVKQLQAMLNCDKLIVFGDGKNDIDMFQIADYTLVDRLGYDGRAMNEYYTDLL